MKTVYVVGGDPSVSAMFSIEGWEVGLDKDENVSPDLVCFTGGSDVMPQLYGEKNTGMSYCNPARDLFEESVYNYFSKNSTPMVGICRGGQFLNVMNGGKLIQHLGHTVHGDVPHWKFGRENPSFELRVDHHQGILEAEGAEVLYVEKLGVRAVVWYEKTRCLCFQPHPEWGHETTRGLFFNLLKEYLNV